MKYPRLSVGIVLVLLLALIPVTYTFAGGGQEQAVDDSNVLRVAFPQDVATFDIMTTTAPPNEVRWMVFEGLLALDSETVPRPHLAESYKESADGLTWTFKLREGVRFHDGTKMTSEDVVASWGRYKEVGSRAVSLNMVEDVVATDERTVEFRLKSRTSGIFLDVLGVSSGILAIYPKWVIDEIGTDNLVELRHMVGTGPYRVVEMIPEERVVLKRYENYTQPGTIEPSFLAGRREAPVETIEIYAIPDPATRLAALEAGDVDLIQALPLDDAPRIERDPNMDVVVGGPGYRIYYKFNAHSGPFSDPLLRAAVRSAVDAEALMAAIGDSNYWRVNHSVRWQEGQWMWSKKAWPDYANDMDKARRLVRESSYNGEEIRFMVSPGRPLEFSTMVPMHETLQDSGLNVKVISVDSATFSQLRRDPEKNWDIKHAGGGSIVGPHYFDASTRDRTGKRWPGVPAEWDELMARIMVETDQTARKAIVERMHELFRELNFELYIGDVLEVSGNRSNVSNVPATFKLPLWNIRKK